MNKTSTTRNDYTYFLNISTRWHDNDVYGHVNNATYYSYIDSVTNQYLINEAGLDIHHAKVIGLVVNSTCQYYASVAYPDALEGALRALKIGNSSVTYEVGIFKHGEHHAAAVGGFTHVFVDRATNKPVPIPDRIRSALQAILVAET